MSDNESSSVQEEATNESISLVENPRSVKILLVGATGYIGRYLLKELYDRNYVVKVLVRDEESLGNSRGYVSEVVIGDATDNSTLEGLCRDVKVVISVMGVRRGIRKPSKLLQFIHIDH